MSRRTIEDILNRLDALEAGGLLTLYSANTDLYGNGSATTISCDGADHDVPIDIASPPTWLDGTNPGNSIITEGLYNFGYTLQSPTAATTPGRRFLVGSPGQTSQLWDLDGIRASYGGHTAGSLTFLADEVNAITAADLPYALSWEVRMQTDATGQIAISPWVWRMA